MNEWLLKNDIILLWLSFTFFLLCFMFEKLPAFQYTKPISIICGILKAQNICKKLSWKCSTDSLPTRLDVKNIKEEEKELCSLIIELNLLWQKKVCRWKWYYPSHSRLFSFYKGGRKEIGRRKQGGKRLRGEERCFNFTVLFIFSPNDSSP